MHTFCPSKAEAEAEAEGLYLCVQGQPGLLKETPSQTTQQQQQQPKQTPVRQITNDAGHATRPLAQTMFPSVSQDTLLLQIEPEVVNLLITTH